MIVLTKTEQDYLKVIYSILQKSDKELATLKELSEKLGVSGATITEGVKRLEKKDLVHYQSYKGVSLTETGLKEARFMVKSHLIWETFLAEVLGYQLSDVHEEAELLEHAASPKMIERVYEFLGKPKTCPHGKPIPQDVFWFEERIEIPLSELQTGKRARVHLVDATINSYMEKLGISLEPSYIEVIEQLEDGSLIVELDSRERLLIPSFLGDKIIVEIYKRN